jgi:hypothetical protein
MNTKFQREETSWGMRLKWDGNIKMNIKKKSVATWTEFIRF